jgi:hypothetical protein
MIKRIRILLLFGLLLAVVVFEYGERYLVRSWQSPLQVQIYPIAADADSATEAYIAGLREADFEEIAQFMVSQSARYRRPAVPPPRISLMPPLAASPPAPPLPGQSALATMKWSLTLRYWAWQQTGGGWPELGVVRVFVRYQQGRAGEALAHSLGLQKGLLGVVNAFAIPHQRTQNNIVIAHELLHTLGASDKYAETGLPIYPQGYAEPSRQPLYPQRSAEIMAGRRALGEDRAVMVENLQRCVVSPQTAYELNWR